MAKSRMSAEQRKKAIIQAALSVIARTNYDRATTAAIAREADINEALIYHHFESKLELLLAVLDTIRDDLIGILDDAQNQEKISLENMRSVGKYFQAMVEKEPERLIALKKAAVVDEPEVREKVWEIYCVFHDRIEERLGEFQKLGFIRPDANLDMFSWALFAWGNFVSMTRILGKGDELSDEKIDNWVNDLRQAVLPLLLPDKFKDLSN